jgi:hypothetical protein
MKPEDPSQKQPAASKSPIGPHDNAVVSHLKQKGYPVSLENYLALATLGQESDELCSEDFANMPLDLQKEYNKQREALVRRRLHRQRGKTKAKHDEAPGRKHGPCSWPDFVHIKLNDGKP